MSARFREAIHRWRMSERLTGLIDNRLSEKEAESLRKHLSGCATCTGEWNRWMSMKSRLAVLKRDQAPADFRRRTLARLDSVEPGEIQAPHGRPASARDLAAAEPATSRRATTVADTRGIVGTPESGGMPEVAATERGPAFRSALIGRNDELRTLTETFARVGAGVGSIVTVVGENGVGKSRLVAEALHHVHAPVQLYEGRSILAGRTLSYHPFIDILSSWAATHSRATGPISTATLQAAVAAVCENDADEVTAAVATILGLELSDTQREWISGLPGDALAKLTHRCVRSLIAGMAATRPLIVSFEDLHWADRSSLALLESLLPLTESSRLCIVLVCRPGYRESSDPVLDLVKKDFALVHRPIVLARLADRECDTLIDNLVGAEQVPARIRNLVKQKTEGNPFYVEEILNSLMEQGHLVEHAQSGPHGAGDIGAIELPDTIGEVIMARVDRLEPEERTLLQTASVLGRRFELTILERVIGAAADLETMLTVLTERRFLERSLSRRTSNYRRITLKQSVIYSFRHAIMQEVVYASLGERERTALHASCARVIENAFSERLEDAYGMLAYHYSRAEMPEAAETYLIKAGELAASSAASAEALQYFREAYELYLRRVGDSADRHKKALLEKSIALALVNTGNLAESVDHFNAALRLYGQWVPVSDLGLWAKLMWDLGVLLLHLYAESSHTRTRRDRPEEHDMFACFYGRCRAENPTSPRRNFFDNVAAMRYLSHVDPRSVEHACGMYASTGAFFAFAGLSFGISERFFRVAERLVRPDKAVDRFQLLAMRTVLDFHSGDWTGKHDIDDTLLEEGQRRGLLWDADVYLGLVCERSIRQGRFGDAERLIEKLADLSKSFGYDFARSNEYAMRALLSVERRDLDRARVEMQAYHDSRAEDPLRIFALAGQAKIEVLSGNLDTARERLATAQSLIARGGRLPVFYFAAYRTARLLCELTLLETGSPHGHTRHATASAKQALRGAALMARELPEALRLSARLYWRLANRAAAERLWSRGIETAERMAVIPELARMKADIAAALESTAATEAELLGKSASVWRAEARAAFESVGLSHEIALLDEGRGVLRERDRVIAL